MDYMIGILSRNIYMIYPALNGLMEIVSLIMRYWLAKRAGSRSG